jgi:hypothetical protein
LSRVNTRFIRHLFLKIFVGERKVGTKEVKTTESGVAAVAQNDVTVVSNDTSVVSNIKTEQTDDVRKSIDFDIDDDDIQVTVLSPGVGDVRGHCLRQVFAR